MFCGSDRGLQGLALVSAGRAVEVPRISYKNSRKLHRPFSDEVVCLLVGGGGAWVLWVLGFRV